MQGYVGLTIDRHAEITNRPQNYDGDGYIAHYDGDIYGIHDDEYHERIWFRGTPTDGTFHRVTFLPPDEHRLIDDAYMNRPLFDR